MDSKNHIFEYKNKLYAITEEHEGKFYVIKASRLPDGKKLIEEIRAVEAKSYKEVTSLIRLGKYSTFEKI